ncbi:hypothetical protein LCGC14_2368340, partial [marine sediment metagenome]
PLAGDNSNLSGLRGSAVLLANASLHLLEVILVQVLVEAEDQRHAAATLEDLDAAASAFRARHGFRLRIATKYHRLIRDYLTANGVADYQLVDSKGATEGTVRNCTAEAIADITSTGETLRANHLKMLEDGPVHASQATLFRARNADWQHGEKVALCALLSQLGLSDEVPTTR